MNNSQQDGSVKTAFNKGLLYRLICKYQSEPERDGSSRNHKTIILVALAKQGGASINDSLREMVTVKASKLGIPGKARQQMMGALETYQPRKPHIFDSAALDPQMGLNAVFGCNCG